MLDVDEAIEHHRSTASVEVALQFVDALEAAFGHIARHPDSGSPRYGHELDLPGIRHWSLKRFPYLIFYVPRPDQIDVWRILHAVRDLPPSLKDAG